MSRDIRSYFNVLSKKSSTEPTNASAKKKKPIRIIDSDEEDIISATPETKNRKQSDNKRKIVTDNSDNESPKKKKAGLGEKAKTTNSKQSKKSQKELLSSSDSEDEKSTKEAIHTKKKEEVKLKPTNVADIFKTTPIKQSKVEPPKLQLQTEKEVSRSKKKKKDVKNAEKRVHDNKDFEKTLDMDDDIFENNMDELERTISEVVEDKPTEEVSTKEKIQKDVDFDSSKNVRKRSRTNSPDKTTPKKKKIEHVDSGIDPGQEAHERKRYSALLYQKYLNRSGPKHHGQKEIPKGKPDCLKNLCFLRTGVLDSLESEEFDELIKSHGGRTVHAVSKKVNYLVVGEDAGPAKLAKAESYNIPCISEDELLDIILTKSGMKPKYCKNTSVGSDDTGIEADDDFTSASKSKEKSNKENVKESDEVKMEPKSPKKAIKAYDSKRKKETVVDDIKTEKTSEVTKTKKETVEKNEASNKKSTSNSSHSEITTSKVPSKTTVSDSKDKTIEIKDEKLEHQLPLSEKYRPTTFKAVIGQQGERSNLYKLKNWLENWYKNQDPKNKKLLIKPSPWAKNDDGGYFKCALLSGSPGVGKTTSATLVAKELGFDIVEFNASDTRSKKLLHEEVAQLLHTKTIAGFASGKNGMNSKRVLLMDEVDGMAGNEDRGGIQELIQLIKTTNIPIICMCNDRNHQKMRSLVNYCYDLRFNKPRLEQIRGAMMSICFKEKIDISVDALSELIAGTGCDVRQTLNHLSVLGSTDGKITSEMAEKESKNSKKDTIMGPWEVCRAVFTKTEQKNMSMADKARLFFFDYSLGPLFVQENYLKVQPDGANKKQTLLKVALTAASISTGDLIDAKIRRSNNWALLESQAFFSSVLPGHYMAGSFTGQINFPAWLGKNSKRGKFSRMQSELQVHTRTSTFANKLAIKLDYLLPLRNAIVMPLKKNGLEGIEAAVSVMKDYNLLREDVDSLSELCSFSDNPMSGVDTKVKTAFTRTYNKEVTLLPYAPTSAISKKKASAPENELYGEEDIISDDENDDDDITKNAMIKVKKKPSNKGKKTAEEPSTSKNSQTKKGKGKKTK